MLLLDSMPNGGWHSSAVAAGQQALVEDELARDPSVVPPYRALLAALDSLPGPVMLASRALGVMTLLDVGCGVGHYGTLLRRHRPGIAYRGSDSSLAMIAVARAREPELLFTHCEFTDNDWNSDIILLSQVAEVTPYPVGYMAHPLALADRSYVIWNRVRIVPVSGFVDEVTYAGRSGMIWRWSMTDLIGLLTLAGRRYRLHSWPERDDMLTIVVYPRDDAG